MLTPKLYSVLKGYNKKLFTHDLFAGLTVGIVALPLAMAFAIASGVPPERGLFTAIIAGFLISFLGGSRVQIGGPTGAFVVIVYGIMATYGYEGLVYCTLIAGAILILLGVFKMGGLIRFIPFPVTTGFTSGIAVVIFSTQIKDLLGLTMGTPPVDFHEKWIAYAMHIHSINPAAAIIGAGVILTIVVLRRFYPRLPAMLIAMVLAAIVATVFHLDIETIGSRFGDLPRTLPMPIFPAVNFSTIQHLMIPAFTVAMLAAIESLLSATVADGMIGSKHRSNMELVAQGVANIGSAIFGGIPATGAIARTATNVKSGAKTPIAGIIHALTLALVLLFFAPYAKLIPLAALAGILVVVSYNMSEIEHFRRLLKAPKSDVAVLLLTFLLTVFIDLTVAVEVGLVLSALLFIKRMAEVTNIGMITRDLKGDDEEESDPNSITIRQVPQGIEVFEIQGPFFFGAAESFKDAIRGIESPVPVIILRLRNVPAIDATGMHALREFLYSCKKENTALILSGVHAQPLFAMQGSGLWDEIGEENIFGHIDDALNRAREILGLPPAERPAPFVPTVAREKDRMV